MSIILLLLSIFVLAIGFLIGFYMTKSYSWKIKYIGPNSNDIKKNIYYVKNTNACYKLIPEICIST